MEKQEILELSLYGIDSKISREEKINDSISKERIKILENKRQELIKIIEECEN